MFRLPTVRLHLSKRAPRLTGAVLWAFIVVLYMTYIPQAPAFSTDLEGEAQLKSSYILNFAKLVEWPEGQDASKDDRFLIGICGDPYLWKACRSGLSGEKIDGSRVALTPLSLDKATTPAAGMKIIFIYSDNEAELKAIIAALADRPILLISDYPNFCQLGGSIGLVWDENRMLFEVNRRQEAHTGFKFNSRLLRVAQRVME